jgi:multisubunit Na+/H+ antiporter MnhB subunit
MGRDTWRHQMEDKERAKRKEINPIWRGVGCFLMVVLSIAGYFFADWLLYQNEINGWFPLAENLVNIDALPWLTTAVFLKFAVAVVFLIISYGLINLVYAILFPVQPGKYDSPPLKPTPRRKK